MRLCLPSVDDDIVIIFEWLTHARFIIQMKVVFALPRRWPLKANLSWHLRTSSLSDWPSMFGGGRLYKDAGSRTTMI